MQVQETITCALFEFCISGKATIQLWDGTIGTIEMIPIYLAKDFNVTKKSIAEYINDGQYGCEAILKANVIVSALYKSEVGTLTAIPIANWSYSTEEIPVTCKRGI